MGQGNKKLSKRDPEGNLLDYRDAGFLPEGLLNYLALLGWAIAGDRDIFSMEEMVEAFDIGDVNPNPARFDLKKAEAINAAHMRLLSVEEIGRAGAPYLAGAGLVADPPTADQQALLDAAMPLVAERMNKLTEAVDMLGFLFVDEAHVRARLDEIDDAAARVVKAAYDALSALPEWTTAAIEEALRVALVEELGLKPRHAFGPVRVAVTGRRVSPPLFESLELLGRDRCLARLAAALAVTGEPVTDRHPPAYDRPPDCRTTSSSPAAGPAGGATSSACWSLVGRADRRARRRAARAVRALVPRRPAQPVAASLEATCSTSTTRRRGPGLPQPGAGRGDPGHLVRLRVLHGLRPRWLASVRPRIRWALPARLPRLSVVALIATLLVSALLPAQGEGTELSGAAQRLHRHHPRLPDGACCSSPRCRRRGRSTSSAAT